MITKEEFNNIKEKISTTGQISPEEFKQFSIYLQSTRTTTPKQLAREKELPPKWWEAFVPQSPPEGWKNIPGLRRDAFFTERNGPMQVLISAAVEHDGKRWLHVSMSRPDRLVSWEDIKFVKNSFIGKEREAIQILPKEDKFVNIHGFVMHLWSCLDVSPLPDFTQGTGSI